MTLQIGKYILHSDQYSLWVDEEYEVTKGKNKGKTDIRPLTGYHTSFRNLLSALARKKLMGSNAEKLIDLVTLLEQIMEDVETVNREAFERDMEGLRKWED